MLSSILSHDIISTDAIIMATIMLLLLLLLLASLNPLSHQKRQQSVRVDAVKHDVAEK